MNKNLAFLLSFLTFLFVVGVLTLADHMPFSEQTVDTVSLVIAVLTFIVGSVVFGKSNKTLDLMVGAFAIVLAFYIALSVLI